MGVEAAVSIISAVVALGSAVITALVSARAGRQRLELQAEIDQQQAVRLRREERQGLMSRVRDPLLWAAFDLQSRIFNIVDQSFLGAYFLHGSEEERKYAKRSTIFVFAQYLAWMEIVRRRVQFLELGNNNDNRELINLFSKATGIFSSDAFPSSASNSFPDSLFRIFRADQRAIGEIMMGSRPDGELTSIGYAEFCRRLDSEAAFEHWFASLSASVENFATMGDQAHPRLVALQHNLVDLIKLLDPEAYRFPDRHRNKLTKSPLSAFELQLLTALASGNSISETADRLQTTQDSVRFRMSTLTHKLGVQTHSEAIEIAKEKEWL
jgi:DNA-binding CsgD family transcriptional regulator